MKVFQIIRKHYESLGINSSLQMSQTSQRFPFNEKILLSILSFGCIIVSHIVYIFYVASGFMEYVECICTTCGSIITFICFATIAFKSNKLFKVIDNIEKFIVTS